MQTEKKTCLVFEVLSLCPGSGGGWRIIRTVSSRKEAEMWARIRAKRYQNQANFDPLAWRVRQVKVSSLY